MPVGWERSSRPGLACNDTTAWFNDIRKPGAVSRPGTLSEFQFYESSDLRDRVKRWKQSTSANTRDSSRSLARPSVTTFT